MEVLCLNELKNILILSQFKEKETKIVSVLYCCLTNHTKPWWLKTTTNIISSLGCAGLGSPTQMKSGGG